MRLYEEIVGRGGVSPSYFFYKMTFPEAAAFMRGQSRKQREEWEHTRRLMWAMLAPHSKKKLELEDIKIFEDENSKAEAKEVDAKEIERIKEIAKRFENE